MSRILVWSPNYAPELTGIPPLVTDAAEWLLQRGHEVEVVTPMPNYPERNIHPGYRGKLFVTEHRNGVVVRRSWLRVRPQERVVDKALYELTATGFALPHVARAARTADAILCVVPTLLAGVLATALRRRPPVVLWVQDLVVAAAATVPMSAAAKKIVARAAALERRAITRADRVIVCSPGFRDVFVRMGADPARVRTLYNWADVEGIPAGPARGGRARFLYAGNIGYTQGLETLVEAAGMTSVELSIVGAGNAEAKIRELAARLPNVVMRTPVPRDRFGSLLAAHDVHVVVQRRAGAGANLPSKIASYLASGRPILAAIEPTTPAADLLRESGAAVFVEPDSPSALAAAMSELAAQPDVRAKLGSNARTFAETRLAKGQILRELEHELLAARRSAGDVREPDSRFCP